MNRNEITQKTTLFEALREIQIDIENIQAKFAFLEEHWDGFPDTFPVEYPLDTEESDEESDED